MSKILVPQVKDAADKEWEAFKTERTAGVEEIAHLRERVAEEAERKKVERRGASTEEDVHMGVEDAPKESILSPVANGEKPIEAPPKMEVDDETPLNEKDEVKKEPASSSVPDAPVVSQAGGADEDDAVEY